MNDDVDFERLLRGRGELLDPPAGAWGDIIRRARRRRRTRGLLAAVAAIAVVGGAVPAVLAVQRSSDNQRLQVAAPQHSDSPAALGDGIADPVVHPSLARLVPTAVSFVSPAEGWVSGVLRVQGGTVAGGLAHTTTGGSSWSIEASHPLSQGTARFADAVHGVSFGEDYQITNDGGLTWQTLHSPGYIAELETANGVIWALVRSCVRCERLRLFQATLTDPRLVRVPAVKPIDSYDAALTLHGHAIYVTGGRDMWASTNDGYSWRRPDNPCDGDGQAFAAWSDEGLAAECTPVRGVGSIYESLDAGRHWTNIANVPNVRAAVGTLSAGSPDELLIITGTAATYVSHHHGNRWTRAGVTGAVISAAYISHRRVVGVTDGSLPTFVMSDDSGRTWTQTAFRAGVVR